MIKQFSRKILFSLVLLLFSVIVSADDVPLMIPYAGDVTVGGETFDGTGLFKFAILDRSCTVIAEQDQCTTLWSNDGASEKGAEPGEPVQIIVVDGEFQVKLGDTSMTAMTAIPHSAFNSEFTYLRVWFNDGTNGFQQLTNDRQLVSVPYAYRANQATNAESANTVIDNSVGEKQIVTSEVQLSGLRLGWQQWPEEQLRVAACGDGLTINTINRDGSVDCIESETYTAGTGLELTGNTFEIESTTMDAINSAAAKSIKAGDGLISSIDVDDAQVIAIDETKVQRRVLGCLTKFSAISSITESGNASCNPIPQGDITTVSAGAGLEGGSTSGNAELRIPQSTLNAIGASLKSTDANNWSMLTGVPAGLNDGDDNTTYSVRQFDGLELVGTQFGIDTQGVEREHIADNAINGGKIQDASVNSRDMAPQYRIGHESAGATNYTIQPVAASNPTEICVLNSYTPPTNQVAFLDGTAGIYNANANSMSPFVAVHNGSSWAVLSTSRGRWNTNSGEQFWRHSSLVDAYQMVANTTYTFALIIAHNGSGDALANGYSCSLRAVFYGR